MLRVSVAGLMLFHGVAKILHGTEPIENLLIAHGLPSFLVFGVYVGEIIAPIGIILGYKVRFFCLIFITNMVAAIGLAHAKDLFVINQFGAYQLELQFLYLFGALSIYFLSEKS